MAAAFVVAVAGCGTEPPVVPDSPEPLDAPDSPDSPLPPAPVELTTGWILIEAYDWPIEPGFSGLDPVGPTSPEGAIPTDRWPEDGFYDATALRPADAPTTLRLTLRRWVSCDDLADSPCAPGPMPDPQTLEDRRITPDPASEVVHTVPIDSLGVVLVPIYDFSEGAQKAIDGEPGAFATLLEHGIDAAYREWVEEPYRDGATLESIQRELLAQQDDPDAAFGVDYTTERDDVDPVAYRGPFGVSLLADPTWTGGGRWPPGPNGLYGWEVLTFEVRNGQPVLHVWAGPIAS